MSSQKKQITKRQESFIRKNHSSLSDSEIAGALGIRAYHVLQFRNDNGLVKKAPNDLRKFEMKGKYFNVNAVDCWL